MIYGDLHLALVQTPLHWEQERKNLEMFSMKLDGLPLPVDLIVLPEMFSTGFSMNPYRFAGTMDGAAVSWMRQTAAEKQAVICGSLMIRDGDRFFNRLIWMRPDGTCSVYDKRHLFGLGEENRHYTAGTQRITTGLKSWKFLPLVCYDLRFPVWCRNTDGYDVLLLVANWPERRIHAWKTLLEARAIENQCYVVAVNRTGNDGHGVYHPGESSVIDPMGDVRWRAAHSDTIQVCTLSHHHLQHTRERLPFLKDMDSFNLK